MARLNTRYLVTGVTLALLAAGCSDSTAPSAPDVDRLILFAASPTQNAPFSLYGVMPDGSGFVRFPQAGLGWFASPRRSRDRKQIAYATGANGLFQIWTMRGDLTEARPLYNSGDCPGGLGNFSWSPSGNRILADCDIKQLLINVADGSYSVTQAFGSATGPSDTVSPDWSPVGDRILYGNAGDMYVANLDGSGSTLVATQAMNARWSPDGSRIAFERSPIGGSLEIFVANADGTAQRQLTFPADGTNDRWPVWSPDGQQLVFIRYETAQQVWQFYLNVINVDGSGLKRITPDMPWIVSPEW